MNLSKEDLISRVFKVLNTIDCDELVFDLFDLSSETGSYYGGFCLGMTPPILWSVVEKNIDKLNMESWEDIEIIYGRRMVGIYNINQKIRHLKDWDNMVFFLDDDFDTEKYYKDKEGYIKKMCNKPC
jgi:hypothetical protein